MSPELALLAAADLAPDAVLSAMLSGQVRREFDWARFARLAADHAMSPIAGARLVDMAPGIVPDEVGRTLRTALRESAAAFLAQTAQSSAVSRILSEAGIRSIVLKGVALSHLLYAAHPEWRRSGDIDLLVDPERFLDADRLLREAGYVRTWPEGELPGAGLDMLLHLANVFTYLAPATGQLLELHHRISLNPYWLPASFDELYAASVELTTASGPIRGLDGPLHVSYLVWHALGHDGYRLKWFCDIVRALRRAETPCCSAYLAAHPHQTSRRPLGILDRVIAALGLAIGDPPRVRPAGYGRKDARRILAHLERPAAIPTGRSLAALSAEVANLSFLWRISGDRKAKTYHLLRNSSDPRDVYSLGLARRFAPLYAGVGPFFAVARLLRRTVGRAGP